jgi:hypothetical protein
VSPPLHGPRTRKHELHKMHKSRSAHHQRHANGAWSTSSPISVPDIGTSPTATSTASPFLHFYPPPPLLLPSATDPSGGWPPLHLGPLGISGRVSPSPLTRSC